MSDLIWIGNTLYPRWVVVGAPAIIFIVLISAFVYFTSDNEPS